MKMKMNFYNLSVFILLLFGCSSNADKKFVKSPVDDLIKGLDSLQNFTIILYDMDTDDSKYKHRYKIVTEEIQELTVQSVSGEDSVFEDLAPKEQLTDWYDVEEVVFDQHVNDMGMELASKVDGKLSKNVAPPGYSKYVGNEKYGNWKQKGDGTSFWEFYGRYAFMTSMFHMIAGPSIYRSHYTNYANNYRGTQPYYGRTGTNGRTQYGTFSQGNLNRSSNFSQKLAGNNDFKSRVNNSVQRSNTKTSAGSRSTSRSNSRYNNKSSSRSRSSSRGGK